uniref:Uncharacterized protein n=1 Tax=Callorhinchus milii TaxID=7868 RepID=A0A4W3JIJ3_CALMI
QCPKGGDGIEVIMASPGSEQKGIVRKESLPETHCLVCCCHYDVLIRKPKVLTCQHVFCAVCLQVLARNDEDCWVVSYPLCRTRTLVSQGAVFNLLDQEELFELIHDRSPAKPEDYPELLLIPHLLTLNQGSTTLIGSTEEGSKVGEGDRREVGVEHLSVLLVVFLITLILVLQVTDKVFLVWGLCLMAVICYLIFFIVCFMSRKRREISPSNQVLHQTNITVITRSQ